MAARLSSTLLRQSAKGTVAPLAFIRRLRFGTRSIVDEVFAAYRFAVLGDNEAVPAKFRSVSSGNPGAQLCNDQACFSSQKEGRAKISKKSEEFLADMQRGKAIDRQARRVAFKVRQDSKGLWRDTRAALRFIDQEVSLYV